MRGLEHGCTNCAGTPSTTRTTLATSQWHHFENTLPKAERVRANTLADEDERGSPHTNVHTIGMRWRSNANNIESVSASMVFVHLRILEQGVGQVKAQQMRTDISHVHRPRWLQSATRRPGTPSRPRAASPQMPSPPQPRRHAVLWPGTPRSTRLPLPPHRLCARNHMQVMKSNNNLF